MTYNDLIRIRSILKQRYVILAPESDATKAEIKECMRIIDIELKSIAMAIGNWTTPGGKYPSAMDMLKDRIKRLFFIQKP